MITKNTKNNQKKTFVSEIPRLFCLPKILLLIFRCSFASRTLPLIDGDTIGVMARLTRPPLEVQVTRRQPMPLVAGGMVEQQKDKNYKKKIKWKRNVQRYGRMLQHRTTIFLDQYIIHGKFALKYQWMVSISEHFLKDEIFPAQQTRVLSVKWHVGQIDDQPVFFLSRVICDMWYTCEYRWVT